jgi:hypothetical protein
MSRSLANVSKQLQTWQMLGAALSSARSKNWESSPEKWPPWGRY